MSRAQRPSAVVDELRAAMRAAPLSPGACAVGGDAWRTVVAVAEEVAARFRAAPHAASLK